jgi:hypothetical protein
MLKLCLLFLRTTFCRGAGQPLPPEVLAKKYYSIAEGLQALNLTVFYENIAMILATMDIMNETTFEVRCMCQWSGCICSNTTHAGRGRGISVCHAASAVS